MARTRFRPHRSLEDAPEVDVEAYATQLANIERKCGYCSHWEELTVAEMADNLNSRYGRCGALYLPQGRYPTFNYAATDDCSFAPKPGV